MKIPKLKHLSYSSLSLFDTCPRCWYLKYVLGYEMPGNDAMNFGSKVHEAIECYHKTGKLPELIEDNSALFSGNSNGYLCATVNAYADVYKSEDFDFVEERWDVPIIHPTEEGRVLELPLQVKIDRIWNKVIRDVKTSASRYKQEQIDGAKQTILYAYAYRQKFGENELGVAYDVLVKNKVPKLQTLDTFVTDQDITDSLWWIWNTWERILTYPEPDYHTKDCWNKGLLP